MLSPKAGQQASVGRHPAGQRQGDFRAARRDPLNTFTGVASLGYATKAAQGEFRSLRRPAHCPRLQPP